MKRGSLFRRFVNPEMKMGLLIRKQRSGVTLYTQPLVFFFRINEPSGIGILRVRINEPSGKRAYNRAPLECIRGPHARSHFLGKGGYFGRSLGKISPNSQEKGVFFFVIANGNQDPR